MTKDSVLDQGDPFLNTGYFYPPDHDDAGNNRSKANKIKIVSTSGNFDLVRGDNLNNADGANQTEWNCTSGTCTIYLRPGLEILPVGGDPGRKGYTPDDNAQEFFIDYVLESFDDRINDAAGNPVGANIVSEVARITINVRPYPRAAATPIAVLPEGFQAQDQSYDPNINFNPATFSGDLYTYKTLLTRDGAGNTQPSLFFKHDAVGSIDHGGNVNGGVSGDLAGTTFTTEEFLCYDTVDGAGLSTSRNCTNINFTPNPTYFTDETSSNKVVISYNVMAFDPFLNEYLKSPAPGQIELIHKPRIEIKPPKIEKYTSDVAHDFIHAVEEVAMDITLSKCDPALGPLACYDGYYYAYPNDGLLPPNYATKVQVKGLTNLAIENGTTCADANVCTKELDCPAGSCIVKLRPSFGYVSEGDFARFEYRAFVDGQWSHDAGVAENWVEMKVQVHARPKIQELFKYSLEGSDLVFKVEKDPNIADSTPLGLYSNAITTPDPIEIKIPDTSGVYQNATFVTPGNTLLTEADASTQAFDCNVVAGECVATLRPNAGYFGDINFLYSVEIQRPIRLVFATDPLLSQDGDPKWNATALDGYFASSTNVINTTFDELPKTQTLQLVGVEGKEQAIEIRLGQGYTHQASIGASKMYLKGTPQIASEPNKSEIRNNDGTQLYGWASSNDLTFLEPSSDGNCAATEGCSELVCNFGVCAFNFLPKPDGGPYLKTNAATTDCVAAPDSSCIKFEFGVEITTASGAIGRSISNDVGDLTPAYSEAFINIRPAPYWNAGAILEYDKQGANHLIIIKKGTAAGDYYVHDTYDAVDIQIKPGSITRGTVSAFTCEETDPTNGKAYVKAVTDTFDATIYPLDSNVEEGTCVGVFDPDDSWVPSPGDEIAKFEFRAEIIDPTLLNFNLISGGRITSATWKQFEIEYRPAPVPENITYYRIEDKNDGIHNVLPFDHGNGYTQLGEYSPVAVCINADSVLNMTIDGCAAATADVCDGAFTNTCQVDYCAAPAGVLTTGVPCDVKYIPTPNNITQGTFEFKIVVYDQGLAENLQSSSSATAFTDFYAQPVHKPNPFVAYTLESTEIHLPINYVEHYEHALGHEAYALPNITGQNGTAIISIPANCPTGKCISFTPNVGAYDPLGDPGAATAVADEFHFTYDIETKDVLNNRISRSETVAKYNIIVFPKPIISDANLKNIPVWENEEYFIHIKKGAGEGYEHPAWLYNANAIYGPDGSSTVLAANATYVTPSTETVPFNCSITTDPVAVSFGFANATEALGACAAKIKPNKDVTNAELQYRTQVSYANITPSDIVTETTGSVTYTVSNKAYITATPVDAGSFPERTDAIPINSQVPVLLPGIHYTYLPGVGVNAKYDNIKYLQIRQLQAGSNMDCTISCPYSDVEATLADASHQFGCGTSAGLNPGECELPDFLFDDPFYRSINNTDPALFEKAKMEFRFVLEDTLAPAGDQTRITDWQDLEFNILPYPDVDAAPLVLEDGVEGDVYQLTLNKSLANGYTHPEGTNATHVILSGLANIDPALEGTQVACEPDGTCNLNLPPIATAFTNIGVSPPIYNAANTGFGWAKFNYEVVTTIDGVELISPTREVRILYRAVPVPENIGAEEDYYYSGFQNEPMTISLAPNNAIAPADTPSVCVNTNANGTVPLGVYCGYEYGDKSKAATHLELFTADPDLIPPSFVGFCDPTQEICEVKCSGTGGGMEFAEDDDTEVNRCTIIFQPLTAGTKTINFKVTVNGVKQSEAGTIEINARDMAIITPDPVFSGSFAENTTGAAITSQIPILLPGVHYTYGPGVADPTKYANINYMQIRQLDGLVISSHMNCDGTACPYTTDEVALDTAAHKFECGTAASLPDGQCQLPNFIFDQPFYRSFADPDPAQWQTARMEFRFALVDPEVDPGAGDENKRFTDWQYLEFNVVPYPDVSPTPRVVSDGVEGVNYQLILDKSLANGYTHPEEKMQKKLD